MDEAGVDQHGKEPTAGGKGASAGAGNDSKNGDPKNGETRNGVASPAPGLGLLYDLELDATMQFGSRELALREVLQLGPGDLIELDRHVSEPVDLVVGSRIVARGEVVVVSGNFALRITEVATPQLRLESVRCHF